MSHEHSPKQKKQCQGLSYLGYPVRGRVIGGIIPEFFDIDNIKAFKEAGGTIELIHGRDLRVPIEVEPADQD